MLFDPHHLTVAVHIHFSHFDFCGLTENRSLITGGALESCGWQFWADPLPLCPRLNYHLPPVTCNTLSFQRNLELTSQSGCSRSSTSWFPCIYNPPPFGASHRAHLHVLKQQLGGDRNYHWRWIQLFELGVSQWDLVAVQEQKRKQQKHACHVMMPRVIFDKSQG